MKIVALVGAVAVSVAGCSSSHAGHSASPASPSVAQPSQVMVHGVVVLTGGNSNRMSNKQGAVCFTSGNGPALLRQAGPWDDFKRGAQVVITDAAGKTVGIGQLAQGATTSPVRGSTGHPNCAWSFTVDGVPAGESFYGIKVGTHSKQITGSEIAHARVVFP